MQFVNLKRQFVARPRSMHWLVASDGSRAAPRCRCILLSWQRASTLRVTWPPSIACRPANDHVRSAAVNLRPTYLLHQINNRMACAIVHQVTVVNVAGFLTALKYVVGNFRFCLSFLLVHRTKDQFCSSPKFGYTYALHNLTRILPRDAMLARYLLSSYICLSVCLPVRLSITGWYFIETTGWIEPVFLHDVSDFPCFECR